MENVYEDKYLDIVRTIRLDGRIAIKAVYTQKHGLPFDNRGLTVSVTTIKSNRHNHGKTWQWPARASGLEAD